MFDIIQIQIKFKNYVDTPTYEFIIIANRWHLTLILEEQGQKLIKDFRLMKKSSNIQLTKSNLLITYKHFTYS